MTDPYYGEIRLMANTYSPEDWAFCLGQMVAISSNTALFSLLGTTYGGDGRVNFGLPDLRGRVPVGRGTGPGLQPMPMGERAGAAYVKLHFSQMPVHDHIAYSRFTAAPNRTDIQANAYMSRVAGGDPAKPYYSAPPGGGQVSMSPLSLSVVGIHYPHENRQPYLCLNYNICTQGIFPPRS